jgi:hypothetical protein
MKKLVLVLVMTIVYNHSFSLIVDSTATINNAELQHLFDACNGSDPNYSRNVY